MTRFSHHCSSSNAFDDVIMITVYFKNRVSKLRRTIHIRISFDAYTIVRHLTTFLEITMCIVQKFVDPVLSGSTVRVIKINQ